MSARYAFHVDLASCIGCKACQVACKDQNGLPAGLNWRRVVEVSGGSWRRQGELWVDDSYTYFVSTACMHCARPVCLEVCPTRAIRQRDDGVVSIDAVRCLGCRYCEMACPYAAPCFDSTRGVMTKCDLCSDRLDGGLPPACVAACPMRVLEVGPVDELKARHGALTRVFPLPESDLTEPHSVFTPHRDTERARDPSARIANREEI